MHDVPIDAIPAPVFVVEDELIIGCNAPARALAPSSVTELVGIRLDEVFRDEDPPYARLRDDAPPRWFRLDAHAHPDGARATLRYVLATDVSDELRARAILEGMFADCFVLDRDACIAWKLTPRRVASSWAVDSHPIEQLHPDDLTSSLARFVRAIDEPGARESFSVRLRHPVRVDHWERVAIESLSAVTDPWLDGVVICSRVDTAVDTKLELADSPFYSLAEAAPTGIIVLDAQRRPVFLNAIARELLAFDDQRVAAAWTSVFAADDLVAVGGVIDAALLHSRRSNHLAHMVRDGTSSWVRVEAVAQHDASTVVGAIVTLVDVTDLIEARADIDRLVDALQAGSDLVLVVEPDMRVSHVKGAGHEHFAALELQGVRDLRAILGANRDGDVDFGSDVLPQILDGHSWRGELTIVIDTSTSVAASVLCVPRQDATGSVESFAFVARDISELKQTQHRLADAAMHDALTGLYNRNGFKDGLDRELARWRRGEVYSLAVVFIDLDDFKPINDQHGHQMGDHVLREVARRMQRAVRSTDLLARVGGDEFVAVLPLHAGSATDIDIVIDRLVAAFASPMLVGGAALRLSASVGVATTSETSDDATTLVARADEAMYAAKRSGKNRVEVA